MVIDRNTTIKALLDEREEEVIVVLVQLNKSFGKLRNPILRKLLAKRVTIADACKIANCPVSDFMQVMNRIGFELRETEPNDYKSCKRPFKLPHKGLIVELDVRPILAENRDPLKEILLLTKNLKENECLKIINSFEPIPLISLLEKKGYTSFIDHEAPDYVLAYFLSLVI